jgi:cysteine synthase A
MNIRKNVTELVGNTPLLQVSNIMNSENSKATILAKLECFNPTSSAKDRPALEMILDAEEKGILKKGSVIIEPTSGNTGIGLAAIGASRGYKVIIVMPDTMSKERILLTKAYGAEVVLTDGKKGMQGSIDEAVRLSKECESAFIPSQFDNSANPLSHYKTTGPEIWRDTDGKVDILVAGIGTGGTLSGTGKYLKEQNPDIKVVGVEPLSSPLITKGVFGPHGIQGIGANFIPENLDKDIYDEIIDVSDDDAFTYARKMAQLEGVAVGISSGAALYGAIELSKRPENKGKTIVVVLTDTGERYLSTKLFSE